MITIQAMRSDRLNAPKFAHILYLIYAPVIYIHVFSSTFFCEVRKLRPEDRLFSFSLAGTNGFAQIHTQRAIILDRQRQGTAKFLDSPSNNRVLPFEVKAYYKFTYLLYFKIFDLPRETLEFRFVNLFDRFGGGPRSVSHSFKIGFHCHIF